MGDGRRDASGDDFEVTDLSRRGTVRTSRSEGPARRRRLWRLAAIVGILALVALVFTLEVFGPPNLQKFLPKPPPPLTLQPQTQGMTCLQDAAWSPQGTRVALLGLHQGTLCPGNPGAGARVGLVTVYDAASGKLVAALHPDDAVIPAVQGFVQRVAPTSTPAATAIASVLNYQHALWSADGSKLAVTFSVDVTSTGVKLYLPDGEPEDVYGVALLGATGGYAQVVMGLASAYEASFFQGSFAFEWDLQAGTIVATPTVYPYPSGTFGVLQPALAYRWQASATPAAETPLSTTAPPPVPALGPVGNPDGASTFTIWQPGTVVGVYGTATNGLLTQLSGVYQWNASFAAWSPNGRYLLDAVTPQGLLELPGTPPPTQADRTTYDLSDMPLLPLRDAWLAQVLRGVNPLNPIGAAVAWRPDGHRLAAYAPQQVYVPHPLVIYDCATGRQLASLQAPALVEASHTPLLTGPYMLLRWSPDGSHLMLFSLALGQVAIWGPQQLPH